MCTAHAAGRDILTVHICIDIYIYRYLCFSISISIANIYINVYMYTCFCIFPVAVSVPTDLSACLSGPSFHLSAHLCLHARKQAREVSERGAAQRLQAVVEVAEHDRVVELVRDVHVRHAAQLQTNTEINKPPTHACESKTESQSFANEPRPSRPM